MGALRPRTLGDCGEWNVSTPSFLPSLSSQRCCPPLPAIIPTDEGNCCLSPWRNEEHLVCGRRGSSAYSVSTYWVSDTELSFLYTFFHFTLLTIIYGLFPPVCGCDTRGSQKLNNMSDLTQVWMQLESDFKSMCCQRLWFIASDHVYLHNCESPIRMAGPPT